MHTYINYCSHCVICSYVISSFHLRSLEKVWEIKKHFQSSFKQKRTLFQKVVKNCNQVFYFYKSHPQSFTNFDGKCLWKPILSFFCISPWRVRPLRMFKGHLGSHYKTPNGCQSFVSECVVHQIWTPLWQVDRYLLATVSLFSNIRHSLNFELLQWNR